MSELNRDLIKKRLEQLACEDCITGVTIKGHSVRHLLWDVISLINKQETEYNELYELLQTYKADSEAYRSYSKTLEKENEALKTLLNESYDTQNSLTEENERLRAENAKYEAENHAEFNKWLKLEEATKRHHSELFEEAKVAVKEDTVRKMQTLIEEKADSCDICLINSNKPIDIIYQISKKQLDQIAKEMLEDTE